MNLVSYDNTSARIRVMRRKRRLRQKNAKLLTGIIAVALMLIFIVNVGLDLNQVSGAVIEVERSFISVRIETDDTLWDLASKYMDTDFYNHKSFIEDVMSMNHLDSTTIIAGEYILLPIIIRDDTESLYAVVKGSATE